ncbi:MAG: cob(I)yrinic acid a,c-diamide adenosyltransferase [Crocinitomicaceae bacterium]|nr:cob(I)yrinic acid a,c-diamide adenosyltransferase [Crocinitomicaceae bacterium]
MKIYTKTGDKGTTGLLGGTRVPKHHLRIESYGNVDELNSYIGLLRDLCESPDYQSVLLVIQENLFTLGSHLALAPGHSGKMKLPVLAQDDVKSLEMAIDNMEKNLPTMKNFILPGGHPVVSHCHIARCVCRRAERAVSALNEVEQLEPVLMIYLNRLSDFLFVLSRTLSLELGSKEIPWKPRG